jgi:hypothetical protein
MSLEIPSFANKQDEIDWRVKNHDLIILHKRNELKHSDTITCKALEVGKTSANKAEAGSTSIETDAIAAKLVINTTNLIDSHMDCHIPGLWNKTLKETNVLYHLEEHNMSFKFIISDSVNNGLKAYSAAFTWKELGFPFPGKTEALIFDTTISKSRNEFMFDQYRKGYVLNHSVGMRYVKMYFCLDPEYNSDPSYAVYHDNWEKYYSDVVNKEVADERGYFYAVTEAKLIEGSAVVRGSNYATPVLSMENKTEPDSSTQKTEAGKATSQLNKNKHLL